MAAEEELAELGCSKACSDQTLVVHVLIHRKNSDGTISWIGKCHVRRIAWTSSAASVYVVRVDYNLFDFAILPKQIQAAKRALLGYIRRQPNDIYQRFLNNSQIGKLLDLLS